VRPVLLLVEGADASTQARISLYIFKKKPEWRPVQHCTLTVHESRAD